MAPRQRCWLGAEHWYEPSRFRQMNARHAPDAPNLLMLKHERDGQNRKARLFVWNRAIWVLEQRRGYRHGAAILASSSAVPVRAMPLDPSQPSTKRL